MKNILFGAIVMATVFLIAGCGFNSNKTAEDDGEPVIINELDKKGNSLRSGEGYGFNEFELEIEIDNKDAIDIEFGDDDTHKYENELTNTKLKDKEAMVKINELFLDILLDKETPDDIAIEKITNYLRIENYSKFELEIEFNDGTQWKIKDVK